MKTYRVMLITGLSTLFGLATLAAIFWISAFPAWSMHGRTESRQGPPVTMDQARELAEIYLRSFGDADLAVDEIMEFEYNFYIVYYEKSTGIGAFEAIIDKRSIGGMMMRMMGNGYVRPEQGPNMLWNTKYGMHAMMSARNGPKSPMLTEAQAKERVQDYLDANLLGSVARDVHPFYGYYTIHVTRNDTVFGMLSVNSYTEQVWYHNWHGDYIQTLEISE